jgi:hypothetical protein
VESDRKGELDSMPRQTICHRASPTFREINPY